ncbi:hypothetical protein L914_19226 [Phytophthora nicotianae]|uniref:Uncharacterized protein n=1 Tax=Phytophthora nicotianae TaxID=4792 RepID=W2MB09_PHYNI|nr:hypothetical protein L914_19226 [Phytophthora nicotianae]
MCNCSIMQHQPVLECGLHELACSRETPLDIGLPPQRPRDTEVKEVERRGAFDMLALKLTSAVLEQSIGTAKVVRR